MLPVFGIDVGRMTRDLAALFRISSVINSIRDLDLLQRELLQLIFEVIPAERGAIVLRPYGNDDRVSVCTWSRPHEDQHPISVQQDLVRRALWERTPILSSPDLNNPDSNNRESVLCHPLVGVEKTIGVIYLASSEVPSPFRDDHVHFVSVASRIAAVTLENILALNSLSGDQPRLKEAPHAASKLVGVSRQIEQLQRFISRVSQSDSTILIRGESGTGKELVARAIHNKSPRMDRPFVAINCAAIPEALLESELFGHERGAFTGAVGVKMGRLEAAQDGTLFLDEIGELAPLLQAKLLRVLQQREFERLGGNRSIAFKARVVAATNKNLEVAIKSGEFRQDLYYRLNVVSVTVPPLRERPEDISLLALYFAEIHAAKNKRPFKGISQEARAILLRYSWPGNVRELESAIEHAIVLGLTEEILPEDLPDAILEEQALVLAKDARYHDALKRTKKDLVLSAIRDAKGNYREAARLLSIHPKYLHRLVRNLDLKSHLQEVE